MCKVTFFFLFIYVGCSQFNMSVFTKMPNKTYSQGLTFSAIRSNSTKILLSINQSNSKIVQWDVENASNVHLSGTYVYPGAQNNLFLYVYFVNGYIMASTLNQTVKLFNQTSYSYIANLNSSLIFSDGHYIASKNVFFFGSTAGNIGYFSVNSLPNISPVILANVSSSDFAFLQLSNNQEFIAASFKSTRFVYIWRVSDFSLIANITASTACIQTVSFSSDNRYLMVFLYNLMHIQVYDKNTNWGLYRNISIGYRNVKSSFYYEETNVVVALSENSKSIFTVNWFDFEVRNVYSIDGEKMQLSDDGKAFTVFQHELKTAWFFNIHRYCWLDKVYNIPSKTCLPCTTNCEICKNSSYCSICKVGYNLIYDGTCQTCPLSTFYQSLNYSCVSCQANCKNCTSSSDCLTCNSGTYLVNSTCIGCTSGFAYNFLTQQCQVSCVANCGICENSTHCQTCSDGYELNNNSCIVCQNGTFYDYLTRKCLNCSSNCKICNAIDICSQCEQSTFLINSSCVTCHFGYSNSTNNCYFPNCTQFCSQCLTADHCKACLTGYSIHQGKCYQISTNSSNENSFENDTDSSNVIIKNQTIENKSDRSANEESNSRDTYNALYEMTMGATVQNQFIALMNKLPGSRRIFRQIFAFFINLDHLWLYIYHNRQYGYYVNRFLSAIQTLQNQKWNLTQEVVLKTNFGLNLSQISHQFDTKQAYTSKKFLKVQNQSSSFMVDNINHIMISIPLLVTIFLFLKLLFYLTKNWYISKIFKIYAFNWYLIFMFLEGNCQEFTYLFVFDCVKMTDRNPSEKIVSCITIVIFGVFVMLLIGGFFIIKTNYSVNSKFFFDNCNTTVHGCINLLIEYSFLNILLGSVHLLFEYRYNLQLFIIFAIESSYILIMTLFIGKNHKLYEFKYIQWQNIVSSFLRICLVLSFFFDKNFPGEFFIVEQAQMYLIILYLSNWIIYTVTAYFIFFYQFIRSLIIAIKYQLNGAVPKKVRSYLQEIMRLAMLKKRQTVRASYFLYSKSYREKMQKTKIEIIKEELNDQKSQSISNNEINAYKDDNYKFSEQYQPIKRHPIKLKNLNLIRNNIRRENMKQASFGNEVKTKSMVNQNAKFKIQALNMSVSQNERLSFSQLKDQEAEYNYKKSPGPFGNQAIQNYNIKSHNTNFIQSTQDKVFTKNGKFSNCKDIKRQILDSKSSDRLNYHHNNKYLSCVIPRNTKKIKSSYTNSINQDNYIVKSNNDNEQNIKEQKDQRNTSFFITKIPIEMTKFLSVPISYHRRSNV